MPSTKRQRTGLRDSGIFLDSDSDDTTASSPRLHKKRSAFSETSGNDRAHVNRASPKKLSPKKGSEDVKQKPSNQKENKIDSTSETETEDEPTDCYKYICFHRPFFDVDGENWQQWTDGLTDRFNKSDLAEKIYKPAFDKEREAGIQNGKGIARPEQHPHHKWVIMEGAFAKYEFLSRKGYGMQEVVQNVLLEFDHAFRKRSEDRVKEMWMIISALGLWLNQDDNIDSFIDTDDTDRTCTLVALLGAALLTSLSAIQTAGHLHPATSPFKDLALVIAYYLEISHDLPAYGIEGTCVAWRKEAVAYFRTAGLDPKDGLFSTESRLAKLEDAEKHDALGEEMARNLGVKRDTEEQEQDGSSAKNGVACEKVSPPPLHKDTKTDVDVDGDGDGDVHGREASSQDQWNWDASFTALKKAMDGSVGGEHYDITKMTKAERVAASYEGKDPLGEEGAGKELKRNVVELE